MVLWMRTTLYLHIYSERKSCGASVNTLLIYKMMQVAALRLAKEWLFGYDIMWPDYAQKSKKTRRLNALNVGVSGIATYGDITRPGIQNKSFGVAPTGIFCNAEDAITYLSRRIKRAQKTQITIMMRTTKCRLSGVTHMTTGRHFLNVRDLNGWVNMVWMT